VVSRALAPVLVSLAIAFVACGDDRPPLLGDPSLGAYGSPDSGLFRDGATGPPTCALGPANGVCGCTELPLSGDPPNVYFVLDRSGSMNDGGKWSTIRTVVASVVSKLGPRIAVGAAVFPALGSADCDTGGEVFSVRRGDSPPSPGALSQTAIGLITSVTTIAEGGTPTAATLRAIAPKVEALAGKTFVILATDGGPNCDPVASCDSSTCIPNIENAAPECTPTGPSCCTPDQFGAESCLDSFATTQAVIALQSAGIPVYVIGVPGSGPYAGLLDQLAVSGGTARTGEPKYYRVDSTDTAAFTTALSQVAAKITATCTLALSTPPSDPSQVNVYIDGVVLPADPVDGWTLSGSTVTLVGATCAKVMAGDVLSVRVIEGCPTVQPN